MTARPGVDVSVDFRSQLHCCQKTAALSFSAKPRPAVLPPRKSCGLFRIATTDPVATISVLTLLRRVRSTRACPGRQTASARLAEPLAGGSVFASRAGRRSRPLLRERPEAMDRPAARCSSTWARPASRSRATAARCSQTSSNEWSLVQTTSDRNRFATAHGAVNRRLHHPQSRRIPVQPTPDIDSQMSMSEVLCTRQRVCFGRGSAGGPPGGMARRIRSTSAIAQIPLRSRSWSQPPVSICASSGQRRARRSNHAQRIGLTDRTPLSA